MKKLVISLAASSVLLLHAAGGAAAAGGGGTSYCSNATKPDGVMVFGDFSTYSNPGEVVSALAPLPGDRGTGWGIQHTCNPHLFGT